MTRSVSRVLGRSCLGAAILFIRGATRLLDEPCLLGHEALLCRLLDRRIVQQGGQPEGATREHQLARIFEILGIADDAPPLD